jgi:hypothetical protein
LNFDLARSIRKFKPGRHTAALVRRPDKMLSFVSDNPAGGPELLLDTCVYIDILQDRIPTAVDNLLVTRLSNHSGIALAELTHLFGRLDPRDNRTEGTLGKIRAAILSLPAHRLSAPSINVLGDAGILAGLASRLAKVEFGREQSLLNDAMLYLQAVEQGHFLLTRNIREFDWFDQLLPAGRVLFYRQA